MLFSCTIVSVIAFLVNAVNAQEACDSSSGVCVEFAIPITAQTTATNADMYVSVEAPGSLGWVGFGFGESMSSALVFVMWEDNSNVVVSPRYASGEFAPALYSGPEVTVISSNITSSSFFTTLLLSNATTWFGGSGSVDIASTSAPLIWALGSQAPSDPSDPTSSIQQHRDQGNFQVNMKAAQYIPTSTGTTSNGTDSSSSNTTTGGSTGTPSNPSIPYITGGVSEGETGSIGLSSRDKIIIAHGVLMGLAFVIFFPLGAIIIRFLGKLLPVPVQLHYGVQIFSIVAVLAAMALGVQASIGMQFINFHQRFGIIIIALLPIQLFFGWYHHHRFVLDQPSSRRWFTHVHLWLGRVIILFGLANCGFGLREAYVSGIYVVVWWVVCGVLAIVYAVASFVTFRYRAKKAGEAFGNAKGPVFSPERYSKAEAYEMMNGSRGYGPPRPGRI